MRVSWNRELKKFVAIVLAVMAGGLFAANLGLAAYCAEARTQYNGFLAAVFGNVIAAYPDVSEEALVQALDGRGNAVLGRDALAHYGVFGQYGSDSFALQERQLLFLRICVNLALLLICAALCFAIYFYLGKRQGRISRLVSYMRMQDRREYRLEIEENEEDELSGLRNEIYKLVVLLREQADRAVGQRRALADSVADLSHQLKTPLTSATVLLDNLLEDPDMDPDTRQRFLAEATNQVAGMSWMVTALLKLSKLDAGAVELQRCRLGVKPLVEEVMRRLELAAELRQVSFRAEIPDGAALWADWSWTAEALLNIVKNAVEHSPAGGIVEVSCEENEVYLQITVRDQGAGISEEERRKLFRRFYNGRSAGEEGVGIGLALAKEIVEKQGGYLSVESEPGKGTAFRIQFLK